MMPGEGISGSAERWAPRVASVLDRQIALFDELESESRDQSELIARGETDRLLEVLSRRQVLIDRIHELSRELAPFHERWESLAPSLPESWREALGERFEAIEGRVREIASRDDADRAALEARRAAVRGELGSLGRGRAAAAAYGRTGGPVGPRVQDRRA
jgi:hypothetical protein